MAESEENVRRVKYSEKLRDPRWQKLRLQVFERDEWTCQLCGDTGSTLAVNHKYYLSSKEPWEYPIDALNTLCESCHSNEYESRPEAEQQVLLALRVKGFCAADVQDFAIGFFNMQLLHLP